MGWVKAGLKEDETEGDTASVTAAKRDAPQAGAEAEAAPAGAKSDEPAKT